MGQGDKGQHFQKLPVKDMKIHSEGLWQKLLSRMLMGSGSARGAQSPEDLWAERTEIPKGFERKCFFEETKLTKRGGLWPLEVLEVSSLQSLGKDSHASRSFCPIKKSHVRP